MRPDPNGWLERRYLCHPKDGARSAPAKVNLVWHGLQFCLMAKERELVFVLSVMTRWAVLPPRIFRNWT